MASLFASPRNRRWLGLGLLLLAVGSATAVAIVKPWKKPPPVQSERLGANLELAAGEVLLATASGSERLLSRTPLPETAELSTGPGARALIRLSDGSRVFLRDGTKVKIAGGVALQEGQIWVEAPPLEEGQKAVVHTVGDAEVSLSAGGASLSFESGQAQVYVAEGLAIVSAAGGRAEVEAGERATVQGGAPTVEPVAFWDDWTGGMGDRAGGGLRAGAGSGALYAVDRSAPAGTPALPLSIQRQTVRVALEDEIAETLVDQRFFNPSGTAVEGWYWFTVPEDALLVSFALETNGQLVEGEIVERKQAAATYEAAVRRDNDPALLEWIDARTVRARIYPVPPAGERRVVLRYQQLMVESEGKRRYSYPLAAPRGREAASIEEFSLEVQLRRGLELDYELATLGEARVSTDGRQVTMRRSGYTPRADFELELTRKPDRSRVPLRANRFSAGGDQASFVMVRFAPDLDMAKLPAPRGDVVVVVDTSAAGDPSEQQTKLAVAEALLRSLSAGDKFAVMSADVAAKVLYPEDGLAEATPEAISAALERVAAHAAGGATDLGAIFEQALARVHGLEQPAVVYVGDGLATSGERSGEALAERLRRSMTGSRARLYTVGVGSEIDAAMLGRLARVGGGEALRVEGPEQAVVRALELSGALKTPTITDLELGLGEGLDDVFVSAGGKLSRGQELVMLARTHHDLPDKITISGRLGGEAFTKEYPLTYAGGSLDRMVPKLWAAAYVERLLGDSRGLEAVRGKILALGLEYGLMTPFTSFLALDSEAAYAQQGIQRRRRQLGGLQLIADATWLQGQESKTSRVVGMIAAAASAPFGCGRDMESAPRSEERTVNETPAAVAASKPAEPQSEAMPTKSEPPPPSTAPMAPGGALANAEPAEEAERSPVKEMPPEPMRVADDARRPASVSKGAGRGGGGKKDAPSPDPIGGLLDIDGNGTTARPKTPPPPPVVSPVPRGLKLPCSDAAARSLGHRRILWQKRLADRSDMFSALNAYEAAAGSCEITGWKDQRVFLQLLHERAATEADIGLLLGHFSGEPDARNYLARGLLRRLVDQGLIGAVERAMFGAGVDWSDLDRQLQLVVGGDAATRKLQMVQAALQRSPGDPQGERRLIQLLSEQGKLEEALARGRLLREQGLMTPVLAQQIGEVFVAHAQVDEAQRIFSEIVEFDADNPQSRALLGDIFLRHGWFERAYRQYEDLVAIRPDDPTASIRLARAAAGAGRVDEGLRILRQVAAGEGRPGVDDPRRFARLHAAVLLARLLAAPDAKIPEASVARELGRLQLFAGAASWTFLVWDDLGVRLALTADPTAPLAGDVADAGITGLFAVQLPAGGGPSLQVRHQGHTLGRPVSYERITVHFDGKAFRVERESGQIAAGDAAAPAVAGGG
ncbi:VIT domain-containing protein [Nannocystis bainbridge]|uniref:VIT domain-containing protein n=1 Tax=Nannocystis bainbridge TaxID=2995303 RepID=A0ABT5EBT4_9BACT|nr:VIT domain-containing protein [Nannocystis bainbridge]MDC0723319.1 VIT domain-containing protein [Nannocystis bainbridge]